MDPHITPEDAYAQVPRISKATGLSEYTLKTILQFNIEKNKVTNVLVFAPNYVNVLEVNMELISGYPDVYQEFVSKKIRWTKLNGNYFSRICHSHGCLSRSAHIFTRKGRKIICS